MNTTRRIPLRARALAAAAVLAASVAGAAETDISQVPPSVKNTVPPNMLFTLDDSGSMFWDVVPDYSDIYYLFPPSTRSFSTSNGTWRMNVPVYGAGPEYSIEQYGLIDTEPTNSDARFFRSAAGNPLFYNPAIRYKPWATADGSGTWPQANRTQPSRNPGKADAAPVDLTTPLTGYTYTVIANGSAQPYATEQAVTIWPATYFVYRGTQPLTRTGGTNILANFDHVEIRPTTPSYPGRSTYPNRSDCGDTCTYDQELQNFANWFSYYRSRLLAARAGIGKAFSTQREDLRIGFATINAPQADVDGVSMRSVIRGVRPFTGAARTEFFDLLYTRPVIPMGTPLRRATDDVGQYFERNDAKSPWRRDMTSSSSELSCFRNFHILMSDGYWTNGTSDQASSTIHSTNVDGTDGVTHQHADRPDTFAYRPVHPYRDTLTGTLADVAMHYWKSDLRPDLANNVPTDPRNPAFWQHLATYTIGFGLTGRLTEAQIASAFTANPQDFTWPDPNTLEPAKLDDLAHAAVNGRGRFFSTSSPDQFASDLTHMLESINAVLSASSASAVSNPNVTSTDRTTYETSYIPGDWTGDLKAFELDQGTGAPTTNSPWSASAMELLDQRSADSRRIATHNGSQGVAFKAGTGGLSGTALSQLQLPSGTDNAAAVIEYLRGERSGERTLPPTFRPRAHLLGAIIHSEPVLVRPPERGYADSGYAAFRSSNANRRRMLYAGANDGMLHAFNAHDGTAGTQSYGGGTEEWAYVPGLVLPRMKNLADPVGSFQATVDGYITVGDADLGNTAGGTGTDWRTLLVGGLGRGGKGFFALDVTTPSAATNADAAAKALWEFPAAGSTHAANVGLSFSRPILVKHEVVATNGTRSGEGWIVIVSSGYNNGGSGDGRGYLYVLNARTGALIRAIGTGVGSSTDPSGLGQISAWVDDDMTDSTVRWVYGGDLQGNLWRFDLTAADPANWTVTRLATLTDPSGAAQPITVAPELARISAGTGTINVVAVGTGRYLGDSDVPDAPTATTAATQRQSFYVIKDGIDSTRRNQTYSPLTRSNLLQRTLSASTNVRRALDAPQVLDWSRNPGWYVDLSISGERVNADPAIASTTLVFVTNVPSNDPCKPGGASHLFQFDLVTGSYALGRNNLTHVGTPLGNALSTRPVLIKLPSGKVVALIRRSDGSTLPQEVETPVSGGTIRRLSWRELNYR